MIYSMSYLLKGDLRRQPSTYSQTMLMKMQGQPVSLSRLDFLYKDNGSMGLYRGYKGIMEKKKETTI